MPAKETFVGDTESAFARYHSARSRTDHPLHIDHIAPVLLVSLSGEQITSRAASISSCTPGALYAAVALYVKRQRRRGRRIVVVSAQSPVGSSDEPEPILMPTPP